MKQLFEKIARNQYLLLALSYWLLSFVINQFFSLLVYSKSNDFNQVIINDFLFMLPVIFGFAFGIYFIGRVNINFNIRLGFVFFLISIAIALYFIASGNDQFYLISIIRGFADGIYWSSSNVIELAGVSDEHRNKFYHMYLAITQILSVLLPVTLGAIIKNSDSFLAPFIISALVCFIAIFIPFKFNIVGSDKFKLTKFFSLFKQKWIKQYIILRAVWGGGSFAQSEVNSILPVYLLKDSFSIGAFASIFNLIAGVMSFLSRKIQIKKREKIGNVLLIIYSFFKSSILIQFSVLGLTIKTAVNKLFSPIVSPMKYDLIIRTANVVLPNKSFSLELLLLNEGLYLFGRIVATLLLLGVFVILKDPVLSLKIFIGIDIIWEFVLIKLMQRFALSKA